ncbi:MAG: hypothetical protein ABIR18_09680 [Chitinophagaceae bacterium]
MKKVLYLAAMLIGFAATAAPSPNTVNEKVLKAFNETFTAAQDVTWHEYDTYAQANFRQDDVQVRAQYDAEGKLLKTTRYYSEKQLLPNIVCKLKQRYAGKVIGGVTETSSDEDVNFVINLKDDKNWYIVKSDVYGNLQQIEKYKRADL